MQVQFEFTPEEQLDASKRFLARLQVIRSGKVKNMVWNGLLTWLIVFAFFYRTPLKGLLVGLGAGFLTALLYPYFYKRGFEKRLRRLNQEIHGDETLSICRVELVQTGVSVTSRHSETKYEWQAVTEIEETDDSVDIFTRAGGGVVVRNRAFPSLAERARFIDLAKTFMDQSRTRPADKL